MGHCFGSEEMMPSTPRPLFRGRTPSCGKINLVLWPAARRTCRSFTTDVTRRFGLQTTKAGAPRWERQCRVLSEIPRSCRSEEHTSELQSRLHLVCRLLLEKKKNRLRLHSRVC